MYCSLLEHPLAYHLDKQEILQVAITGFSGRPYANRHFELYKQTHHWEHLVLGSIQCCPIIGALAALIERIVYAVYQLFSKVASTVVTLKNVIDMSHSISIFFSRYPIQETCEPTASEQDLTRMITNANKAFKEHKTGQSKDALAPRSTTVLTLESLTSGNYPEQTLKLSMQVAEKQGKRTSMEDTHLYFSTTSYDVAAVFDGHAGPQVAAYAKKHFQDQFIALYNQYNCHVFRALEETFLCLQKKVLQIPSFSDKGSTAIVCVIDKIKHLVYTATLGDSEAFVYRNYDGFYFAIPLSCVRDWSCKKDFERGQHLRKIAENNLPTVLQFLEDDKKRRFEMLTIEMNQRVSRSINVSRALGDCIYHINDKKGQAYYAISQKPKITVGKLEKGDLLILSCDGYTDYVTLDQSVTAIKEALKTKKIASYLASYALKHKSKDNVTVMSIEVK